MNNNGNATNSSTGFRIFNILILIIVYFFIMMYFITKNNKEYVKDNWNEYKCKPYIIPFASNFNPDIDTTVNFRECMYQTDRNFFDVFSSPLLNIFNLLSMDIKITSESLNGVRGFTAFIRNRLNVITENLKSRFTNLDEQLRLFMLKLNDMFKKMTGLVRTMQYMFVVLANALEWIFEFPGKIAIAAIMILISLMTVIVFFLPFF